MLAFSNAKVDWSAADFEYDMAYPMGVNGHSFVNQRVLARHGRIPRGESSMHLTFLRLLSPAATSVDTARAVLASGFYRCRLKPTCRVLSIPCDQSLRVAKRFDKSIDIGVCHIMLSQRILQHRRVLGQEFHLHPQLLVPRAQFLTQTHREDAPCWRRMRIASTSCPSSSRIRSHRGSYTPPTISRIQTTLSSSERLDSLT
jgi:hypothetical protein